MKRPTNFMTCFQTFVSMYKTKGTFKIYHRNGRPSHNVFWKSGSKLKNGH